MKAKITAIISLLLVLCLNLQAQITLKVGDAKGPPGKEVEVPILISGSTKVGPMQFILDYDHRMLEAIADPPGAEPRGVVFGKIISGGMIAQNVAEPGEVKIALRTDDPITQDGEIVRVRFVVKGKKGDSCTLNLLVPEAWEKESLFEVPVRVESGTFTAAGLSLSIPLLIGVVAGVAVLALVFFLLKKRSKTRPAEKSQENVAPPPAAASAPAAATTKSGDDPVSLLKKLKEMQEAGIITPEEFDAKKKDLLARL